MICTQDSELSIQKQKKNTIVKESSQKELILLCIVCLFIALIWPQKIPNSFDSTEIQKLQSGVIFHRVSEQPIVSWLTPHWVCISRFNQDICPALHQSTQHDFESTQTQVWKHEVEGSISVPHCAELFTPSLGFRALSLFQPWILLQCKERK